MAPGDRRAGFEDTVIAVIRSIRPGDWMTYGEVAEAAGHPGAARAVGSLLRISSEGLPWWRVVGHGGRLVSPSPQRQADLLRREGVLVDDRRVLGNRHRAGGV